MAIRNNVLLLFVYTLNRLALGVVTHFESNETFKCLSGGEYVQKDAVCNGKAECSDGSDEKDEFCLISSCESNSFRCAYGACVNILSKCNGTAECLDGSDEDPLLCHFVRKTPTKVTINVKVDVHYEFANDEFRCTSGQYIAFDNVCDGTAHCEDKSDETREVCLRINCPRFTFQCNYGACIDRNYVCNKKLDCVDGSDEFLCNAFSSMIPQFAWSQASNCILEKFRCDSGQYINEFDVCDGKAECIDKTDEIQATCSTMPCPPFAFKCFYGACVPGSAKCNGTAECADGSDEDYILCGNKLPASSSEWVWGD